VDFSGLADKGSGSRAADQMTLLSFFLLFLASRGNE